MIPYKDLADLPEDERIQQIGEKAMKDRLVVGFFVDSEGPDGFAKADRYISKLKAGFPGIHVMHRGEGLVADTKLVKVGPPLQ